MNEPANVKIIVLGRDKPADVKIIVLGRDTNHEKVILETTHLYTGYIE